MKWVSAADRMPKPDKDVRMRWDDGETEWIGNIIWELHPLKPSEYYRLHWWDESPLPPSIEELNQEFKELNIYLKDLYHQMVNQEKDAGNLWIQFTDKFNAYQKKVVAKLPSIEELAQKLREANPYKTNYAEMRSGDGIRREGWDSCVDKLIELSKELK